jgi:hypothetical protein
MKTKNKLTIGALCALNLAALLGATDALISPEAQITFIVKDDFGKPVSGALVKTWTYTRQKTGGGVGKVVDEENSAKTNKDGYAKISVNSLTGDFTYNVVGGGNYYRVGWRTTRYRFKEKKEGRWEPWNPTVKIIYKPILKPIAMYQGRGRLQLPAREKEIGLDLSRNDFVSPYGKGKQADMIFRLAEKIPHESFEKPYDYRLKITFPNKGDGIQSHYDMPTSGLDMSRYAPTDGYESNLELKSGRDETEFFKQREDQNYFFRVRTQLDKDGRVKSALYGKIVGNIDFWRDGTMEINYCLNSTPLDVNMEHDPEKNLIPKKEN